MIQTDQAVGRGSGRGAWTLRERGAVGLAGLVRPHQAARGCVERRRAGRESVAWCSACSHPAQPSTPTCSLCAGSADACASSSSAGTRGGSETRPGPAWPLCAAVSQACSRPCATRCVCVLVVRLGTPRSAPCSRPRRRIQRLVRQENWAVRVGACHGSQRRRGRTEQSVWAWRSAGLRSGGGWGGGVLAVPATPPCRRGSTPGA